MPTISAAELSYYLGLERGVYALNYHLEQCWHPGWCDHKYEVRRLVRELTAQIDARKALAGVVVAPAHSTLRLQEG